MKSNISYKQASKLNTILTQHQQKILRKENLPRGNVIGVGGFSRVWRVSYQGKQYAYKAINLFSSTYVQNKICDEIAIHLKLDHPNIISLQNIITHATHVTGLLLDYADRGTLEHRIYKDPSPFTWETKIRYLREIFSALDYIHSNGIVHQDLKTENLLLSHEDSIKLCDFGVSIDTSELDLSRGEDGCIPMHQISASHPGRGTPAHKPPEIIDSPDFIEVTIKPALQNLKRQALIGSPIDIYAASICAYQIITRKILWPSIENIELLKLILVHDKAMPGSISLMTPEKLRLVYERCHAYAHQDRPSAREALAILPTEEELKNNKWRKQTTEDRQTCMGIFSFFQNQTKKIDDDKRIPIREIDFFYDILQLENFPSHFKEFPKERMKLSPLGMQLKENLDDLHWAIKIYLKDWEAELDTCLNSSDKKWKWSTLNDNEIQACVKKIPEYFLQNNPLAIALAEINLLITIRQDCIRGQHNLQKLKSLDETVSVNQRNANYKIKREAFIRQPFAKICNFSPWAINLDDNVFNKGFYLLQSPSGQLTHGSTANCHENFPETLLQWGGLLAFNAGECAKRSHQNLIALTPIESYLTDDYPDDDLLAYDGVSDPFASDPVETFSKTHSSV